jgi:hypothetical protein
VVLLVSFNLLKLEKGVSESEWNQRETSRLLRAVFERDRNDQLKERIRERVVRNLVELSMDQYGNNVVQACFIPSIRMPLFSAVLLQRGLQAFLRLPGQHLWESVQNHCARYVLRTSVDVSIRLSCHANARAGRSIVT